MKVSLVGMGPGSPALLTRAATAALARAELFIGSLPDHIRVDVEMKGPQDLQTAMYYARAFERSAVAI